MSKRFRRLSHTIYECKYHLVFCPKYRRAILKDEMREYVKQEIISLLRQKEGIEIIEMNVQSRPRSFDRVDTAEICSVSGNGLFERETGDSAVSAV